MLRCFLAFVLVSVVSGDCSDGFLHHGESCYAAPETEATWAQATLYCRILGAKLAIIETLEEQHYLEGFLQRMTGSFIHDRDFWIGGSDFLERGRWIWTKTKSVLDPATSSWAQGEPSNVQHQSCLRMSQTLGYKWESGSCDSKEYFICEKGYGEDPIVG